MRAITKFAVATAAFLSMSAAAGASQATIFIGLQEAGVNGGLVTTVASGATFAMYGAGYGTFELEALFGGDGISPTILGSNTFDTNAVGAGGTLDIYVTRDGITGPNPPHFRSTFTSNVLPAGWTVLQTTYYSASNALYGGTTLSSKLFSTIGTFEHTVPVAPAAGPYSLTTRFTISAPTTGLSQNTTSIHAVIPEPATWALMIMGFGGAGAMLRSRRRTATVAI